MESLRLASNISSYEGVDTYCKALSRKCNIRLAKVFVKGQDGRPKASTIVRVHQMYLVDYLEVTYARTRTYVIDGFVKLVRGSGLWDKQQDFAFSCFFTSAQISRPSSAAVVKVWEIDCKCSLSAATPFPPRRLKTCGKCDCDVLIFRTPYKSYNIPSRSQES